MVDSLPGISFEDQLDFAEKANIPSYLIIEKGSIDFRKMPISNLEKALATYQLK